MLQPVTSRLKLLVVLCAAFGALLAPATAGAAKVTSKKAIWGPVQVGGVSQFPRYADLGAGIFQAKVGWDVIAPTKPADPTNPEDPAYHWDTPQAAQVQQALAEAPRYGMQVLLMVANSPSWSNGGKDSRWAPTDPQDYADFLTAASRHWPAVKFWMVWGEPCRGDNFRPAAGERKGAYGKPLTRAQQVGPRAYARLLDAAYGAVKAQSRSDLVVGGNCFTGTTSTLRTDISPLNWMRYMRLPNGHRPRLDLYGHNAISARRPDLRRPQIAPGAADFSDLDLFARWLDRYGFRGKRIFVSEWVLPTDHFGAEATFYVSRRTAAAWTTAALRITRRTPRIYSFGWFQFYDEQPNASGDEATYGLVDSHGRPKPAYAAFKAG